jgi:hypothetical protein
MLNPIDLGHLFADINLPEGHQRAGTMPMQEGATK